MSELLNAMVAGTASTQTERINPHSPTADQQIRAQCLSTALHSAIPGQSGQYQDIIKRAQAYYDFIMCAPAAPATVTDIKAVE